MKARWRISVAISAALLGAGAPALAQEADAPPQNEVIGPPQLRDFSINGTVTREAPAPVDVQTRQRSQPPASQDGAQSATARPSPPPRERAEPATRSAAAEVRETSVRTPADSGSEDEAQQAATEPRLAPPAVTAGDGLAELSPQPALVPAAPDPALNTSQSGVPILPWLAAALALLGAAAFYFRRHRLRESYAGAGRVDPFESLAPAPSPAPAPPPAGTPSPPASPAPSAAGIVSTRLRPWLELEFQPQRGVVDDEKAAIAFELSVFNSGSVPAREILLEATLFNAGPVADQQIRLFFDNPVAKGDRIPLLAPMQRVTVSTAVFLPRDQVKPIEVEGRPLFVPMIAFNALYKWGGGAGQTSASYLVGKTTKGEKLAPFRLDLGGRVFRNLAAREHDMRLRK